MKKKKMNDSVAAGSIVIASYALPLLASFAFSNTTYFQLKDPDYDETSDALYFREPKNTITNLAFLALPYVSKNAIDIYSSSVLCGGSIALHALGSPFSTDLDRLGMFAVVSRLAFHLSFDTPPTERVFWSMVAVYFVIQVLKTSKIFRFRIGNQIIFDFSWQSFLPWIFAHRFVPAPYSRFASAVLRVGRGALQYKRTKWINLSIFTLLDLLLIPQTQTQTGIPNRIHTSIALVTFIVALLFQEKQGAHIHILDLDTHWLWHVLIVVSLGFAGRD